MRQLTAAQREAVEFGDGQLLILAGPGSGKTRVMTHRIASLLHRGVPARQVLALTFTNKAAEEMKQRVALLAPGESVWISTFHRFCARLLRQYAPLAGLTENYTIYDTQDSGRTLKRVLDELELDALHYGIDQIASAISWAKNRLISPDEYTPRVGSTLGAIVKAVYPAYQAQLLRSSAVDFDDLLFRTVQLLRDSPEVRGQLDARYRHVLVDEYQDTNFAQYALVRALSADYPNLVVCGDPDQSIYGWRGANIGNILDFERDYPDVHVVRLEQNYRSTKNILRVADQLIGHNRRRKPKQLFTDNIAGPPVRLTAYATQLAEAEDIARQIVGDIRSGRRRPKDVAVFMRTNALSRTLETALREAGVPYMLVNGVEFYQRREVRDLLGYLQLVNNPRDDNALLRVINVPPRGIGATTVERLKAHARRYEQTLLEAARESGLIEGLAKRSAVGVARFVAMFDRISEAATRPVEEIVGLVLAETDYRALFADSEDEDDQNRLANIDELLSAARQFDEHNPGDGHLEEFLETTALVNDTDELAGDAVMLMTLHAAKGLEFPVVYLIAVEEGLLPHERSRDNDEQLEEERRLLFVGITRAREELQLSIARVRDYRGQRRLTIPSSFLLELPREEMELNEDAIRSTSWDLQLDETSAADVVHVDPSDHEDIVDEPPTQAPTATSAYPALTAGTALQTAAELGGATKRRLPALPLDAFRQGMRVTHPTYGAGTIAALSGSGSWRVALVRFDREEASRKFILERSELRPA
ncbi:MAG: UvrD-helicase domain-containing protein [Pirellulales bacterium]|nr:UvrD-helicase domain-containing protein [Pirellulales bacterium]